MKKITVIISALLLAISISSFAFAFQTPNPEFPIISAMELKAELDSGKKVFIVDVRRMDEYKQGHLPGAINVPPKGSKSLTGSLPKDKGFSIVFYCRGWG
jgi:3-mercaptopyruvate sulfurtransferase SseA